MVVVCYCVSRDCVKVRRTVYVDAMIVVGYGVFSDSIIGRTMEVDARRKVLDVCVFDCNIVYAI